MLLGRVGTPPEFGNTIRDKPFAKFSMATNESWKNEFDEWQEKTEWHKIMVFKNVENIMEYVKVGNRVVVQGKLSYQSVERADGYVKNASVIADEVIFLSPSAKNKDFE